jgi:hypothetical protein
VLSKSGAADLGRRPAVLGRGGREAASGGAPSRTERSLRDQGDLPLAVVAGTWITVTPVLFGAMIAALTVGVVTALGRALWHNWPRLSGRCAPGSSPVRRWSAD